MAKPYSITITNGEGSSNILNDTYTNKTTINTKLKINILFFITKPLPI